MLQATAGAESGKGKGKKGGEGAAAGAGGGGGEKKVLKKTGLAIGARKDEDFAEWYTQTITLSEMIEYYDVSGCYILRPWAFKYAVAVAVARVLLLRCVRGAARCRPRPLCLCLCAAACAARFPRRRGAEPLHHCRCRCTAPVQDVGAHLRLL